jgi:hypothetical protein
MRGLYFLSGLSTAVALVEAIEWHMPSAETVCLTLGLYALTLIVDLLTD